MTPLHASPEQVRGDVITTTSDVYVLGLLLYELLCGRRPFQLMGSSVADIERVVCEEDAIPPSAMVARTAQESSELLAALALARSSTPARMRKQLQGDLDCIILMALRKDSERRYSSAEHLAADLERYVAGQPVLASRDTWVYRTKKFVARHALVVTASAIAIVMLSVFAAITAFQARRIAQERDVATAERTRAEEVSSFLVELFELSDPEHNRGNEVTAREVLDIGARRVSVGLVGQPETRATLLNTIGRVYGSLGLYTDSVTMLEDAVNSQIALHGPRHPDVALALVALGSALFEKGDLSGCEAKLTAALRMQRELLGPSALAIAPTLTAQGVLAKQRGELKAADRDFQESWNIYRQHGREHAAQVIPLLNEMAELHSYRGEYRRAEMLYRTMLDINRGTSGNNQLIVAADIEKNLAVTLQMQGKLAEAEPLYVDTTRLVAKIFGDTHPHTLDALANYGRFLHRKGDLAGAEPILQKVLASDRKARGETHVLVGHDLVNLGLLHIDSGAYADAIAELSQALTIYEHSLPSEHPYIASALAGLGRAQLEQGRLSDAEQTLRRAMEVAAKTLPADSAPLASAKSALGRTLLAQGQKSQAEPLLRESESILAKTYGDNATATVRTREALARLDGRAQ